MCMSMSAYKDVGLCVCVCLSVRIMNSPRCCPPLICGRKAQLGQKAEGEGEGYRGKAGLKEPLQKQVTSWSFSPHPLRREAFRVKPTGRKSRGLLRSKACWDQSRIHLLPDQLLPFSLSVRFLFWLYIFILHAPLLPEAIWDLRTVYSTSRKQSTFEPGKSYLFLQS